jgi:NAD(P)-dependent dehydrogenase (short-subunit alcohol dehydrogenase family)
MTKKRSVRFSRPTIRPPLKDDDHKVWRKAHPRHRHTLRDCQGFFGQGREGSDRGPPLDRCGGTARDRGRGHRIAADVGTAEGRTQTLHRALDALGGLDILVNNACGVRAEQLEAKTEAEIEAMLTMDLLRPILLTRAAPWITELRRSSATHLAITRSQ